MKQKIISCSFVVFLFVFFNSCQKQLNNNGKGEELVSSNLSSSASEQDVTQECDGRLRTQSPGGWGASPTGNNPGVYLHANFAAAFPNGLVIGCYPNDFYVSFTSAQAITDYMPAGGTPRRIHKNFIDPDIRDLKNSLVDHVIALTLSTGFDLYDPNFAAAENNLGFMVVPSGLFAGKSVYEILAEANKVLGGCGGAYSASELTAILDQINSNYTDGTVDNGVLICPGPR